MFCLELDTSQPEKRQPVAKINSLVVHVFFGSIWGRNRGAKVINLTSSKLLLIQLLLQIFYTMSLGYSY